LLPFVRGALPRRWIRRTGCAAPGKGGDAKQAAREKPGDWQKGRLHRDSVYRRSIRQDRRHDHDPQHRWKIAWSRKADLHEDANIFSW